jgi:hypothetical protein
MANKVSGQIFGKSKKKNQNQAMNFGKERLRQPSHLILVTKNSQEMTLI